MLQRPSARDPHEPTDEGEARRPAGRHRRLPGAEGARSEKALTVDSLGLTIPEARAPPREAKARMTKSELIEAIAARGELTKARAELVVNCIFEAMTEALQKGEGIEIRG